MDFTLFPIFNQKKNLTILTGAGISQESGIETYRDQGGLLEKYNPSIYASISGWFCFRDEMIQLYDTFRNKLQEVKPNSAHEGLVELEKYFNLQIITQNVDDLHERSGSKNILHLHGELTKIQNENTGEIREIKYRSMNKEEIQHNFRPYIVWFGEKVHNLGKSQKIMNNTEVLIIIGTSLQVSPASDLIRYLPKDVPIIIIDPNEISLSSKNILQIKEKATVGIQRILQFNEEYQSFLNDSSI